MMTCRLALVVSMLFLALSGERAFAQTPTGTDINSSDTAIDLGVEASLPDAERQAIRLLIYGSILSSRAASIVEIPVATRQRYADARAGVFAAAPTGILVPLTRSFDSVVESLGRFFRTSSGTLRSSSQAVSQSSMGALDRIGIRLLVERSARSLQAVTSSFRPVLGSFATRGAAISSYAVLGTGLLASSGFMSFYNTPESALSIEAVRNMLGYDQRVRAQIDQLTQDLASIFLLDPAHQATFKEALVEELLRLAIRNHFRRDASYEVDVLALLERRGLIDSTEATAGLHLREIYRLSTADRFPINQRSRLAESVNIIAGTAAILTELIDRGELERADETLARSLLHNADRALRITRAQLRMAAEPRP